MEIILIRITEIELSFDPFQNEIYFHKKRNLPMRIISHNLLPNIIDVNKSGG